MEGSFLRMHMTLLVRVKMANRYKYTSLTNLDGILKSRDISLSTEVRLVKAMVFLVVMHGCESWTVKKAEH